MASMQTVYCVPIDEQGDEIQQDPVLQIPLANIYSDEKSTNTLLRMLLNFGAIAVFIIGIMAGTPFIYQTFITNIIRYTKDPIASDIGSLQMLSGIGKHKRLEGANYFSMILFFITSVLLICGFLPSINDQLGAMFGVFFIIGLFIAFARIEYERSSKTAKEFYKYYLDYDAGSDSDVYEFPNIQEYVFKVLFSRFFNPVNPLAIGLTAVLLIGLNSLSATYLQTKNPGIYFFILWFSFYLPSFLQLHK